ncbi:prepilin-type N-terminal cleavage/methylation domain-containing protein [Corallococcus exercitus]|uniref:PilW family protein n=1 Tax=Corallococcus exercitus TaxID=2316736 RepID=UPI000EA24690|nr:prepilin-type N-terminal cleavage/methylation domain-containing protein [Corallococcus exercitus]RKG74991.1 prepilin-type N-terminal cleavage/methylation domain-containing protein [Corallococcus exercitus]
MKPTSVNDRGFTLLEVMIASALGVIVLTTGLVVGTQMQKRALFEEQTMVAQITGRAVKEQLTSDLSRAGAGMGNTPISFSDTNLSSALMVWSKPDLKTAVGTTLTPDPDFVPAPTEDLKSDAIQVYWGSTRDMLTLRTCGGTTMRDTTDALGKTFCTTVSPSAALATGGSVPVVFVSGGNKLACPGTLDSVDTAGAKLTLKNPFTSTYCLNADTWKPDTTAKDPENWLALRLDGAAYRVNWKGNIPTLEYQSPGMTTWAVLSRDVEQMTVREGVMDFDTLKTSLDWYPGDNSYNVGVQHPPISQCTRALFDSKACFLGKALDGTDIPKPATDEELIRQLRQRVRLLEVSLVIRTRRVNQDAVLTGTDEEGYARDGYKRRRFTFMVEPRNFASVGLVRLKLKEEASK